MVSYPHDLVQAQRDWTRTYQALSTPGLPSNPTLRRRLLQLSNEIWWHPHWSTRPSRHTPALVDLRLHARTGDPRAHALSTAPELLAGSGDPASST